MPTTGGALAFDGYVPPYEATLTRNLRDAGAIIIAKTGMTELANWVAGAPTDAHQLQRAHRLRLEPLRPAARSARGHLRRPAGAGHRRLQLRHRHRRELLGGQRRHRDARARSSAPANQNMLAGIKPTVGRISRYGVIPITADQDTRGPDGEDGDRRRDPAGRAGGRGPGPERRRPPRPARRRPAATTRRSSNADALKGARIGIPRAFYYDKITPPGDQGAARRPQRRSRRR